RHLLYDDILDMNTAIREHKEFTDILKLHCEVFEVLDLLEELLENPEHRVELLRSLIKEHHTNKALLERLMPLSSKDLAQSLIMGVKETVNTLTEFISDFHHALPPLPNFLYTRDTAVIINNCVLPVSMLNPVRMPEATIIRHILKHNTKFSSDGFYFESPSEIKQYSTFEGGDILVIRDDVLAIGISERTSSQAIDQLIEFLRKKNQVKHILTVQMPKDRALIHLDMAFTMLDHNYACIYEPAIYGNLHFGTYHIDISEKTNKVTQVPNIMRGLHKIGLDIQPILCGGNERLFQDREQWMCGANYFTMAPGKIIGYRRCEKTFEQIERIGRMTHIEAEDVISGKVDLKDYDRYAIAFKGAELSRGGGGARCMTLPIERE
ncbi:MAG: arginine deiminase family protein, partial [Candidatus Cloacimonetes bacterium]|nr:arginine deiminase family protein [Candidatus Cloacimonadota bacterium]